MLRNLFATGFTQIQYPFSIKQYRAYDKLDITMIADVFECPAVLKERRE
jgi:hypothetical protein